VRGGRLSRPARTVSFASPDSQTGGRQAAFLMGTKMKYNLLGKLSRKQCAQLVVVVLCAGLVKFYYSTASVNELRWILAPTKVLVEFVTGKSFAFEAYTGYMSSDHTFVIAASCAGVNFLITAFLMLSLRKIWRERAKESSWSFIANTAAIAYLVTLIANTARISLAVVLLKRPLDIGLNPDQLHRFEGVFVYFAVLLLLFLITERLSDRVGGKPRLSYEGLPKRFRLFRRSLFPVLVYYAVTLGVPIANGAYKQGSNFTEHAVFVLVVPLLLLLPVMMFSLLKRAQRAKHA
jgi:exosortase K